MSESIIVTGCSGFIGFHTAKRLLENGKKVVGIDNINPYYSQQLKQDRSAILGENKNFTFHKIDLTEKQVVDDLCSQVKPECVIHLAAQAGVRWSIENPWAYLDSNLTGFLSILESCRHNNVNHLIYASSSSVYGSNTKLPFSILYIQKTCLKLHIGWHFLLIPMASYFHKTTRWQQMLLVSWVDSFLKGSIKFCRKSFQNK